MAGEIGAEEKRAGLVSKIGVGMVGKNRAHPSTKAQRSAPLFNTSSSHAPP